MKSNRDESFLLDPVDQFIQQVQRMPKRTAVSVGSAIYTYEELYKRVNSIAIALEALGVTKKSIVAIALDHDIDLIAAPLAILKLGAVYLPIDRRLPATRLNFMMSDAGPDVVLATGQFISELEDKTRISLDINSIPFSNDNSEQRQQSIDSTDAAYIIYTSGSTGNPKGVVVSRGNLANYCTWASIRYFDDENDRIALYSTLSFDFTATCIFPPLMRGCGIVVYDGVSDPFVIKEILKHNRTQVLKITPAYLEVLTELVSDRSELKRLIVGGEDLKTRLAMKAAECIQSVEIINEYGPTEATVGCMNHVYSPKDDVEGSVPIGKAIDGVLIELLNDNFEPVKGDEIGEIFIFGDSVATQYLNNKEANKNAFLMLPKLSNRPGYRTGDFARRNVNGDLIFLGRRDSQVKVYGNRVELGEVEAALSKLPFISAVHVTCRNYLSTKELVAAIVLQDDVSKKEITSELAKMLPDYLIPANILVMDRLPMTDNQKIDQHAILVNLKEERNEFAI